MKNSSIMSCNLGESWAEVEVGDVDYAVFGYHV